MERWSLEYRDEKLSNRLLKRNEVFLSLSFCLMSSVWKQMVSIDRTYFCAIKKIKFVFLLLETNLSEGQRDNDVFALQKKKKEPIFICMYIEKS